MALLESLAGLPVELTLSLFGQHKTIRCKLLSYEKPFIEIEVAKTRRLLNENAVKEIIKV